MANSVEDDVRLLGNYSELEEAVEITKEIKHEIDVFLPIRNQTLRTLRSLKKDVEESYDKSRKSRIGGTVATVTGSILAITGFGLSFVTFGAAAAVGIAGAALATAGGVTVAGADIGYRIVSSGLFKEAQEACERDRNKLERFVQLNEQFSAKLQALEKKSGLSLDRILKVVIGAVKSGKLGCAIGSAAAKVVRAAQLTDSSIDFVKAALGISSTLSRAAGGAKTVWTGLSIAGRAFSVASVVFDVVLIPIDLGIMIKSAIDVHKFDGGKGESNSAVAASIGELISKLEENVRAIENLRDTFA